VYFGVYRAEKGLPVPLQDDGVLSLERFLEFVASLKEKAVLLGDGVTLCRPRIGPESDGKIILGSGPFHTPRASNLAFLAGAWKGDVPSGPVLPRYLRKPG